VLIHSDVWLVACPGPFSDPPIPVGVPALWVPDGRSHVSVHAVHVLRCCTSIAIHEEIKNRKTYALPHASKHAFMRHTPWHCVGFDEASGRARFARSARRGCQRRQGGAPVVRSTSTALACSEVRLPRNEQEQSSNCDRAGEAIGLRPSVCMLARHMPGDVLYPQSS